MYQEKGFKTIFDDIKANTIYGATIKEDEVIKPKKSFSVNNDDLDFGFIVDEYKMPSFKLVSDNLVINDFYDYPDVIMSQNPEYKYKYPKLSTEEAMRQYAQTEEGVPNELNRFIRQDENGESLEDIKEFDDIYTAGLNELNKMIDDDTRRIEKIKEKVKDKTGKEQINTILTNREDKKEKIILRGKAHNPVKIGSAFSLPRFDDKSTKGRLANANDINYLKNKLYQAEAFDQDIDEANIIYSGYNKKANKKASALNVPLNKGYKEPQNKNKELTEKIKTAFQNSTPQKMVTRSEAKKTPLNPQPPPPPITPPPIRSPKVSAPNTFKPKILAPVTPQKEAVKKQLPNTPEEINKLTKIQSKVRGNIAKKLVEEKRKLIDNSDEKTVVQDTTPPIESFKLNQNAYNLILAKYKDRPNTDSIDSFEKEDVVKIKGLMKNLSINLNTKRLDKLRNKFKT